MAQRRMFSKKITDTDKFLEMPLSTQALYFHLNMSADDEGFIDRVRSVQRTIGASDDDLKILIAKQFIIPFESGIVVIKDWRIHNYIQSDRMQVTQYTEEKSHLQMTANKSFEIKQVLPPEEVEVIEQPKPTKKEQWANYPMPDWLRLAGQNEVKKGEVEKATQRIIVAYLNQEVGGRFKAVDATTKHINARLAEGHTLDEFKQVIDAKVDQWGNDPKMSQYLRPATLFGTKFSSYLSHALARPTSNIPQWAETEYRTTATQDELAELEKLRQEMRG